MPYHISPNQSINQSVRRRLDKAYNCSISGSSMTRGSENKVKNNLLWTIQYEKAMKQIYQSVYDNATLNRLIIS